MCIAMKFIGQSKLMVIPNFKGVCVAGIQYLWCPEVEKNQTPVKSSGDYHSLPLLLLEGGGIHSTVYLKKFFVKIFPPNPTFDLYVHLNVKLVLTTSFVNSAYGLVPSLKYESYCLDALANTSI